MAAACPAGAASHDTMDWQAIDWPKVYRMGRRLQARSVKAEQAGRRGKVNALHRLLTHSFSGRALAVRRVTSHDGKRTPGVDGVTWTTPAPQSAAVYALRQHGDQPQPVRRVDIPKRARAKMRPLSLPSMTERALQALARRALEPLAETRGDPNSYGFRTARSPADAMAQGFNGRATRQSPPWSLEGDIRAGFDTISHAWVLAHIPMEHAILQKWLCAGDLERHVFHPTEQGTPQGGTGSPVLANLPRDGLEPLLRPHYPKAKRAGKRAQVNVIRCAEDFIVTGRTTALLEEDVKPLIEPFLRARGLELSAEQTRITHSEDGVDCLGQNLRKDRGKLLINPAKSNVQAVLAKVRGIIKAHKQAPAGTVVLLRNPVIRGGACFHQHVVSKPTLRAVAQAIFHTLWQWARRRHPTKPTRWVKEHYWDTVGGRHWVFPGEAAGAERQLFAASSIAITRHINGTGEANPFDPAWEGDFEHRLQVNMAHTLKGRRPLLALWKAPDGRCPICHQPMTARTGWHRHHRLWQSKGGPDTAVNRGL